MKSLSHLLAFICCLALLLNGPALAQEAEDRYLRAIVKTVTSETILVAEIDSQLVELIEEQWASNKVQTQSPKDLRYYYGGEFRNWSGLTGSASRSDTSATTPKRSKSERRMTGAAIGATIGAIGGLLLYEIGNADIGLCNEGDPGCTTTGPSRGETMLIFGGIGAVVGFPVGG